MNRVSELVYRLQDAIENGDDTSSVRIVTELTRLRPKLCITEAENNAYDGIRVKVHIEDRVTDAGHVTMSVLPSMTVRFLKQKVYVCMGFPPEVQQWIIGKHLATDTDLLGDLAKVEPGMTLYLYLTTAQAAGLTRKGFGDNSHELLMKSGIHGVKSPATPSPSTGKSLSPVATKGRPLPPVPKLSESDSEMKLSHQKPATSTKPPSNISKLPSGSLKSQVPVTQISSSIQEVKWQSSNLGQRCPVKDREAQHQLQKTSTESNDTGTGAVVAHQFSSMTGPWSCTRCTYAQNKPINSTCELCEHPRQHVEECKHQGIANLEDD